MNELLLFIHIGIIVVGFFVLFFMGIDYFDEYGADVSGKTLVISIVLYLSVILFCAFGFHKMGKQPWNYSEPYATEKIVCLNDTNQINGRFYMRRGYIGEKLYYQYMVKLGAGYKANKVGADNTTLYYDNDNFRVEWCEKERHWLYFSETEKYQKIYIPEGSITDDYSIDLQ